MKFLICLATISARLLVSDQPEASKVLAPEKIIEAKKTVVTKPEATKAVVKLKEKVTEEKKASDEKPEEKVRDIAKPEKIVEAKTVVDETTTAMTDVAPEKMVEEKVVAPATEEVSAQTKKTLANFYSSLVLKKDDPEANEELYKKDWGNEWDNGNHPSWKGNDYKAPDVAPPKKKGDEAFWWLWMVVITIAIVGGLWVWYNAAHNP